MKRFSDPLGAIPVILRSVWQAHLVRPVIGAELEWYLRPQGQDKPWDASYVEVQAYFSKLYDACETAGIELYSMDKEDGAGQAEIALPATQDVLALAEQVDAVKQLAQQTATAQNLVADFSAKPYPNQHGSGMHFHLHLEDEEGHNLFSKRGDDMSEALQQSLAGLLAVMPEHMSVFAPHGESWQRFEAHYNAPVNASWGTNNRTVALRLPDGLSASSGVEDIAANPYGYARRIEHRVAGSDANPAQVIEAILLGVEYGFARKPELSEPIYGNAADAQYQLPAFQKEG